jgi:hypothetical protein
MIARNIVIVIFLNALCIGCSTPGVTGIATEKQAKLCYIPPNSNNPAPWGTSCGNGNHCDGHGTCCTPIQTNPKSCQQSPIR